jgi:FkbM family methyltransferase
MISLITRKLSGLPLFRELRILRQNRGVVTTWADALQLTLLDVGYRKAGHPAIQLGIAELKGRKVWCRPGTTDNGVLKCTFREQYHLPPKTKMDGPRVIVDLGANVGYTMAHFAAIYPQARIIGVEMDRGNYEMALQNIAQFGGACELVNAAIWHERGEVTYSTTQGEEGFHACQELSSSGPTARALPVADLFSMFNIQKVDYLKMDIEGVEHRIFDGAAGWANKVSIIKVEVHPPATVEGCYRALTALGFDCCKDTHHWATVIAVKPRL